MWRNYLTVAFRTLARSPAYAAVNIGGLALGLAGSLLILAYVNYERSYDSWLRDADRLYQVQMTVRPPNMAEVHSQAFQFPLYEGLAGFSQVEAVTSLDPGKTVTEHDGQPMFIGATTVDPEFFKVFALPFVQGSAATALPDTNSIVLTESEAIRQFGTADALGKLLSLGAGDGKRDYRVSGVLRDLPRNTSLRLGIIFRRNINQMPAESRSWGGNENLQHYVKLRAGADAATVNAALPAWKKRAWPPQMFEGKPMSVADAFDYRLVPLGDVHLGQAQEKALTPGGDPRALATFAIVALLTLGMAVMNFVNLTTARATQRGREVALRKVLGATRRQLIVQFLGESLLIAAAAMLIALTIAELTTPWIGHLMGAEMRITYLGERGMLLPALGLFAVTGLAGGLYPALYLSRFRPAQVLRTGRAAAETPGSGRLRAALVVVQFAVAIGLIASTAVIWSQTRFIERVDPGYRRDGLIQITNAWRFTQGAEYEAARPQMLAIPGVTGVGRAGLELGAPETPVRLMRGGGGAGAPYVTLGFYSVDADFPRTMGIDLLAGRLLGDRFAADRIAGATPADLVARGANVVINRSAAAKLGYRTPEAAIGQSFEIAFFAFPMVPSRIVGVVEDTRFRTARDAVDPIVYVYDPEHTSQVLVRYAGARPGEVMAGLNRVWRRFEPEIPFEARFADDIVRELYAAERARGVLFAAFSALAVVIACLGLYSLAAFATEQRTKEIGIRKVVGATVRDIVRLLVWQFSKPVVLANLIAWPAAWWAMRDWLNGFDARIALGPGPFALAGLLALAIAVATVAGHALRVARINPIHALRYE